MTASFSRAFQTRSLAPGLAKWSPAAVPRLRWSAIIRLKAAVVRSSTLSSSKAPAKTTMPGPLESALASSAWISRRPSPSASRGRTAVLSYTSTCCSTRLACG